jgi:hypothetical protein
MGNVQSGTRELRILAGILVGLMFAVVLTAWTDAGAQLRARAVAPSPDPEVLEADLYFDSNSSRLKADAVKILQEKAALMELGPRGSSSSEGHADPLRNRRSTTRPRRAARRHGEAVPHGPRRSGARRSRWSRSVRTVRSAMAPAASVRS